MSLTSLAHCEWWASDVTLARHECRMQKAEGRIGYHPVSAFCILPSAFNQMLRTATRADLPLIRDILARGNDVPYDLAAVAEEKAFGAGFRGAPRVRICDDHGVGT